MEDIFINPKDQETLREVQKIQISYWVRITSEVYKVLDFLPNADSLKNRAKDKALAILENATLISDARGWFSLQKEKASAQLLDDIEVLKNYLKIAKQQKWIDGMNFLIIVNEYNRIKSSIDLPKGLVSKNIEVTLKIHDDIRSGENEKAIERPQILITSLKDKQKSNTNDNKYITGIEKYPEKQDLLSPKALARQGKILQILNERRKAQVSDLIKELPNITKRTIRRDLDDLLKKGKIMRIGEWNQVSYTLKETYKNSLNSDRT